MLAHYYQILGISEGASEAEIKKAYRRKARQLHPDVNKAPNAHDQFVLLNEAYEYLTNRKTQSTRSNRRTSSQASRQSYREWQYHEREKARERAKQHAKMRYEEFKKTDYYKTSQAMHTVLDFVSFIIAICILTIVPGVSYYYNGKFGLIASGLVILLTFPVWARTLFANKAQFDLHELVSSFKHIGQLQKFQLFLGIALNVIVFVRIGLHTLIPFEYLCFAQLGIIATGFVLSKKVSNPFYRKLIIGVGAPLLINVLLFVNYVGSSNEKLESYRMSYKVERYYMDGRMQDNGYPLLFDLNTDKYDRYFGLRYFIRSKITSSRSVTYHFEDGLLGVRVLKDVEFDTSRKKVSKG